jgi:hypothetical protein
MLTAVKGGRRRRTETREGHAGGPRRGKDKRRYLKEIGNTMAGMITEVGISAVKS